MRRNRIIKNCLYCSKPTEIIKAREFKFKYCSLSCHGKAVLNAPGAQAKIKRCKGSKNGNWKGGRRKHSNGYVWILIGEEYILEHRYVMMNHVKRPLLHREQIHHINGDKLDNRIENLLLLDIKDHTLLHWKLKRNLQNT